MPSRSGRSATCRPAPWPRPTASSEWKSTLQNFYGLNGLRKFQRGRRRGIRRRDVACKMERNDSLCSNAASYRQTRQRSWTSNRVQRGRWKSSRTMFAISRDVQQFESLYFAGVPLRLPSPSPAKGGDGTDYCSERNLKYREGGTAGGDSVIRHGSEKTAHIDENDDGNN